MVVLLVRAFDYFRTESVVETLTANGQIRTCRRSIYANEHTAIDGRSQPVIRPDVRVSNAAPACGRRRFHRDAKCAYCGERPERIADPLLLHPQSTSWLR